MEKQKLKKLKDYAQKIGICRSCLRREVEEKRSRCKKCIEVGKLSAQKRRNNPNNCSRCGQKKIDSSFKCCEKCRR